MKAKFSPALGVDFKEYNAYLVKKEDASRVKEGGVGEAGQGSIRAVI